LPVRSTEDGKEKETAHRNREQQELDNPRAAIRRDAQKSFDEVQAAFLSWGIVRLTEPCVKLSMAVFLVRPAGLGLFGNQPRAASV
jgi:hypothetical protein